MADWEEADVWRWGTKRKGTRGDQEVYPIISGNVLWHDDVTRLGGEVELCVYVENCWVREVDPQRLIAKFPVIELAGWWQGTR